MPRNTNRTERRAARLCVGSLLLTGIALGVCQPSAPAEAAEARLQSFTWPVYDGPNTYGSSGTLEATPGASGNPVVFSSTTPETCTTAGENGAQLKFVKVGTCTIVANEAGDAEYAAVGPISREIQVNPAPLALRANPQRKVSGSPDPTFSVGYDGLVNGDTSTVVSGLRVAVWDLRYNGPVAHDEPGRYAIHLSGGSAANYTVTRWDAILDVDASISLNAVGLPKTWTAIAPLVVDGLRREVPYHAALRYDATTRFTYAKVLSDSVTSEFYIAWDAPDKVLTGTSNYSFTAYYRTIPDLVDAATMPDGTGRNAAAAENLKQSWVSIRDQLHQDPQLAVLRIPRFASQVRSASGVWMDTYNAYWLMEYLQVLYTAEGGQGTL